MAHLRRHGEGSTYVFEAPVRIWHWVMMLCMFALCVTGYLIGTPPPSTPGEATNTFVFGFIRYIHFACAYVFSIMFALRVYWAFVGNRYSREIFLIPLMLFSVEFWKGFFNQVAYYLFIKRHGKPYNGHNPLAAMSMFFMYVLGTIFMIVTGFGLYGEGTGAGSWAFRWFSSWVIPLVGQSQDLHTWHHLGMWYLILFSMVHMYMVVREDIYSDETVISTMVNGWRVPKS